MFATTYLEEIACMRQLSMLHAIFHFIYIRGIDVLSGEAAMSFFASSNRGLLLQERIYSHWEQILYFREDPFSEGLWC